eukprot:TRINITY_DN5797_c0_g2_i1.p1 TRINITY_DN5797_c0_g2~~TRINITY_DN5797_c0_g2_i1.p1  ORF type:complete len:1689 (+),score=265.24 TRINITY_DN5797_c0_g2_i1:643-5067(+)
MAKQTLTHMLSLLFTRLHNATVRGTLGDALGEDDDTPSPGTSTANHHSRQSSMGGFTDPSTLAAAQLGPASDDASSEESKQIESADINETQPHETISTPESRTASLTSSLAVKRDPNDEFAYKDCFQTFRGLCKLSMKKVPPNINNLDSIEVRSKILSLELLLSIFDNSAYSFAGNARFVNSAIKKHLFMSLLMNGTSSISLVFRAAMSIFLALIREFREFLKTEIEVFFTTIILPLLESSTSSLQQKIIVVRDLHSICKTPQVIMDLFINYDCDAQGKDIVEQLVKVVSKLAQRKMPEVSTWGADTTEEENTLKQVCLKTLAVVAKSLSDWSQPLHPPASSQPGASSGETQLKRLQHELDAVEQQKTNKLLMDQGKEIFKDSWKKGMAFFIKNGLCQNTHEDIAKFLRYSPGLDKPMIGEYLAERDTFNNTVLNCYRDLFDFTGMHIDLALREFLAYFRIPGEGQKVDRVMVAFADRYIKDCPDAGFGNADAVYFLAFSIIMLATDQHSSSVKQKMKKEDWKRLLLGQNDGKDFDDTMLDGVFARIAAEELKLKDDAPPVAPVPASPNAPAPAATPEDPAIVIEKAKELIKDRQYAVPSFLSASNVHYAGLVVPCVSKSLLSAFSHILEDSSDEKLISMVLEGIRLSIGVACIFDRQSDLSALLTMVSQMTLLDSSSSKEMKSKNIDCTRLILGLPLTDGDYLGECWTFVVKVLSLVESLHTVNDSIPNQSPGGSQVRKPTPNNGVVSLESANAALITQAIPPSALDRIFTHSSTLDNIAVIAFVKAVCAVSADELAASNPRSYLLQKLVEIAAFNMKRVRGVWNEVWSIMAAHFTTAALHKNHHVANLALDSLKQSALKFLDREELNDMEFQALFMKPFVDVYDHELPKIRELVVHLLAMIMRAKASALNSGWACVFQVFGKTARDSFAISELGLSFLAEAREKHFAHFADTYLVDYFQSVSCFATEPKSPEKNAIKALTHLRAGAADLISGRILIKRRDGSVVSSDLFENDEETAAVWLAILKGLALAVSHPDINIRPTALEVLSDTLMTHGNHFSAPLMSRVFREVLLPIFDGVLTQARSEDNLSDSEWLLTTCLKASHAVLNVYSHFYDSISFLLSDLLRLIHSFVVQENETLATFGVTSYETLLSSCSARFTEEMWLEVARYTAGLIRESTPLKQIRLAFAPEPVQDESPSQSSDLGTGGELPKPVLLENALNRSGSVSPVSSPAIKRVESSGAVTPRASIDRSQAPATPSTPASAIPASVSTPRSMSTSRRNRIMSVGDFRRKIALGKVRIQSLLIRAVRERVIEQHGSSLDSAALSDCLDSFLDARATVRTLVRDPQLRAVTEQSTLSDAILRLETESLTTYVNALFSCRDNGTLDIMHLLDARLEALIELLVKEHLEAPRDGPNESGLALLLTSLVNFPPDTFKVYARKFYAQLVELCMSESVKVRGTLRDVLSRIGDVAGIDEK